MNEIMVGRLLCNSFEFKNKEWDKHKIALLVGIWQLNPSTFDDLYAGVHLPSRLADLAWCHTINWRANVLQKITGGVTN